MKTQDAIDLALRFEARLREEKGKNGTVLLSRAIHFAAEVNGAVRAREFVVAAPTLEDIVAGAFLCGVDGLIRELAKDHASEMAHFAVGLARECAHALEEVAQRALARVPR